MQQNLFPEGSSQLQPSTKHYTPTIKDLPPTLRPTERLNYAGPAALSTAELLSIILGSGGQSENAIRLAERLLVDHGSIFHLSRMSTDELAQIHNIGPAKAARLKATFELAGRIRTVSPEDRPRISSPGDVAALMSLEMSLLEQEHLRVILMDTTRRIMHTNTLYIGNVNTAIIRVCEVFKEPIRRNATQIMLVHNHPSGDPTPSPEDVAVTRMIADAGKLLDIEVLDHIIIGRNSFVSLKERGLFL